MAYAYTRAKVEAALMRGLTEWANEIANQARSNASWSNTIPNAISVGQVKDEGGRYSIEIKIDARKDGPAPEALAFEFGSGIHNPDSPGTYVIAPKPGGKKTLAFFWDKVDASSPTGNKFRGVSPTTGKAIFNYVDHPGVAAKPYLAPAIRDARVKFKGIYSRLIGRAYRESVKQVTVIK